MQHLFFSQQFDSKTGPQKFSVHALYFIPPTFLFLGISLSWLLSFLNFFAFAFLNQSCRKVPSESCPPVPQIFRVFLHVLWMLMPRHVLLLMIYVNSADTHLFFVLINCVGVLTGLGLIWWSKSFKSDISLSNHNITIMTCYCTEKSKTAMSLSVRRPRLLFQNRLDSMGDKISSETNWPKHFWCAYRNITRHNSWIPSISNTA